MRVYSLRCVHEKQSNRLSDSIQQSNYDQYEMKRC